MSRLHDVEVLLRHAAAAATRREPLAAALRQVEGPLAATVAARLANGSTLPEALAGALPPEQIALLAGPRPALAEAALLAADELAAERVARAQWIEQLAHPLLSLLIVTIGCVLLAPEIGAGLEQSWLAAAGAVAALAVAAAVVVARRDRDGPGGHRRLARRWERAALAAGWRLPEAALAPLLGGEVAELAAVLARVDAADHCRRLAAWHREVALRQQRHLGRALAAILLIAGAAVILAATVPAMNELTAMTRAAG